MLQAVGAYIDELMLLRGMTPAELAAASKTSAYYPRRWIRGEFKTSPRQSLIERLVGAVRGQLDDAIALLKDESDEKTGRALAKARCHQESGGGNGEPLPPELAAIVEPYLKGVRARNLRVAAEEFLNDPVKAAEVVGYAESLKKDR